MIIYSWARYEFIHYSLKFGLISMIKYKKYQLSRSNLFESRSLRNDTKLTRMTLFLSLVSIISHSAIFITFVFIFFSSDAVIVCLLIMLSILSISLKHALNFLIFYYFNKNFKIAYLITINCKSKNKIIDLNKSNTIVIKHSF